MELAEAAQQEALADIQPRPARRPSVIPGLPDVVGPYVPRECTFGQLFTNLARCVRQSILLEARLAGGAFDHIAPAPLRAPANDSAAPTRQPNPNQPATENHTRLRPEPMEDECHTDSHRPPPEILAEISANLDNAAQTGLAPTRQDPPPRRLRVPPEPPPLTSYERIVQAAIQHGVPPPNIRRQQN